MWLFILNLFSFSFFNCLCGKLNIPSYRYEPHVTKINIDNLHAIASLRLPIQPGPQLEMKYQNHKVFPKVNKNKYVLNIDRDTSYDNLTLITNDYLSLNRSNETNFTHVITEKKSNRLLAEKSYLVKSITNLKFKDVISEIRNLKIELFGNPMENMDFFKRNKNVYNSEAIKRASKIAKILELEDVMEINYNDTVNKTNKVDKIK